MPSEIRIGYLEMNELKDLIGVCYGIPDAGVNRRFSYSPPCRSRSVMNLPNSSMPAMVARSAMIYHLLFKNFGIFLSTRCQVIKLILFRFSVGPN